MLKKVMTASLLGVDADFVLVETDLQMGLPGISVVGLADTTIKEAKERIRSAIVNSGFQFPKRKITVNLSPAGLPKEGSHFDLPIAIGILGTENEDISTSGIGIVGELSLDGTVNGIRGALPLVLRLREEGIRKVVLPWPNAEEAALLKDVEIYPVKDLTECAEFLEGKRKISRYITEEKCDPGGGDIPDFADVIGQETVKRALMTAAAGNHGILMMGSPGSGKTMMAKRLPYIMPDITYEEMLEITKIHSAAGHLSLPGPGTLRPGAGSRNSRGGLQIRRPFRAPHHTITKAALIGGGRIPRPGELSLAHNGILFLDEFGEFDPATIELLRQPLEEGYILLSRARAAVRLPSRVMLVAAANPCRCGYLGDDNHICTCTSGQLQHYYSKFSGPMLDRIDMHIRVPSVMLIGDATSSNAATSDIQQSSSGDAIMSELQGTSAGDATTHELQQSSSGDATSSAATNYGAERTSSNTATSDAQQPSSSDAASENRPLSTAAMKQCVQRAVDIQRARYIGTGITSNSCLTESQVKEYCRMSADAEAFLEQAFRRFGFSMRTYYKLLKVARTIADLDETNSAPALAAGADLSAVAQCAAAGAARATDDQRAAVAGADLSAVAQCAAAGAGRATDDQRAAAAGADRPTGTQRAVAAGKTPDPQRRTAAAAVNGGSMPGGLIQLRHIAEAIRYRALDDFYRRADDGR